MSMALFSALITLIPIDVMLKAKDEPGQTASAALQWQHWTVSYFYFIAIWVKTPHHSRRVLM